MWHYGLKQDLQKLMKKFMICSVKGLHQNKSKKQQQQQKTLVSLREHHWESNFLDGHISFISFPNIWMYERYYTVNIKVTTKCSIVLLWESKIKEMH